MVFCFKVDIKFYSVLNGLTQNSATLTLFGMCPVAKLTRSPDRLPNVDSVVTHANILITCLLTYLNHESPS